MRSWFYRIGAGVCGFVARVLWGARVEGVEHIPRSGAFILVANHCSNLDPVIIGWAAGNTVGRIIHFMAKSEVRRWPIIGWLATQSAVYFVRRGEGDRAAQRFSLEALADGRPIALFPEGTRSRDGHLRTGKPGSAFLAVRSGAPLLPVAISGTHRIFPGRSRWPHPTRIVVRIGQPFSLPHLPSGRLDREALAEGTERIMSTIEALLPPDQRRVA
ncbi:MAG TPA: lysophospholipid acyltransferase family protein [Candidatus Limnocylindria bacterium]|nr:lysophospholipid acyltransferase family protein [Candidatus Limnocylindria bacterium]